MQNLEQAILDLVNAAGYRPVKPRAIAQQLNLPKAQEALLRKTVKRLVRDGRLAYGANHLVKPTAASLDVPKKNSRGSTTSGTNLSEDNESASAASRRSLPSGYSKQNKTTRLEGVFQRTQKGFGFVRLSGTTDPQLKDVYIPAEETRDAADGDLVLVELDRRRRGPGPRGRIVEIVERQTRRFVGTYFESADAAYVRIDGRLFAQPIYVGDPGAKNAQTDDKVVIEMLRFPSPLRDGEGVVVEVLGPHGTPGVDTLSIIREYNLPEAFAADAQDEARRATGEFDAAANGRMDLTAETIITIDPVDARDFDDAISLDKLDDGGWRLGVHIADVSHFVPTGGALDREARDRATSVYLPDRVLPMLPELISNGLASLQPGKPRLTLTAIMYFTADGLRTATELHAAVIRSSKRLTYEQVDAFLEDPEAWRRKLGAKVFGLLGRMHELAMLLRGRRLRAGALELTMPEVKIELDKDGRVVGAHATVNTVSHQIIEEFMLAANEAVAETLRDRGLHFLRRVHPAPSVAKLNALTEFIAELGYRTGSLADRFELQKLLDASANRPERHAVHFAVLRSLQKAVYSPADDGHYALASQCYCHFTSPIRRYPDLTVHRLVKALLDKSKPRNNFDELVLLGRHCSDREQRAETAERELTKLKLLTYFSSRIGEEMDAVVTGVESYGLFVEGVDLPAQGLVRVETLRDDRYRFDRASHTLSGFRAGNSFRLGDLLRVAVAEVDLERREIDFRIVYREKKPRPAVRRLEEKQQGRREKSDHGRRKPPTGQKKRQRRQQ